MSDNIIDFIKSSVDEKPVSAYDSIDAELQSRIETKMNDIQSQVRASLFNTESTVTEAKDNLLKFTSLSPEQYQKVKKRKGFNRSDWVWNRNEQVYYKKKMNEELLDEAKDIETWHITYSYGAGKGGRRETTRIMTGLKPGTSEDDVKKLWNKKHPGKKFISAIKEDVELEEAFSKWSVELPSFKKTIEVDKARNKAEAIKKAVALAGGKSDDWKTVKIGKVVKH